MKITKIKDNISKKQYKHLLAYLKADEISNFRKERLLRVFTILYHTGLRANETSQITYLKIKELIETKTTTVIAHKQSLEKRLYITDTAVKELKEIFKDKDLNSDLYIITSIRSNKNTVLNVNSLIGDVNSYLVKVFPNNRITSHSFRQSIITELAEANINTKVIQSLIGHKSISSTYRYIKPSQEAIANSIDLVR